MSVDRAPEAPPPGPSGLPAVTRRQLVALLGCSIRSFADLETAAVVTATRPGRGGRPSLYDVTVAVPAYIRHLERVRQPNGERDARTRRDLAQAHLAEQLHRRRAGELLEVAEVRRAWSMLVVATRAKLLAMPQALADRCTHAARHAADEATARTTVQAILREEIHNALRELASGAGVPDDPPTPTPAPAPKRKRSPR